MTIMRRIFTLAVVVISAITLGSCGKEYGGTSEELVGTWHIVKYEYKFDGKTVGVEIPMEDEEDEAICIFKKGGECQIGGIPMPYSYSSSTHTLVITMFGKVSFSVRKLTSSEMVWSDIFPSVKTTAKDKKVDEYDGKVIYKSNDYDIDASSYYYRKGDKLIPCEKIDPSAWTTFTGDEDGYYDERLAYFERVE